MRATDPVAGSTCGVPSPQGAYHPFRDASLSPDERVNLAQVWLGYYFSAVHDLDSVTPELLNSRTPLHENALESSVGYSKTPTTLRMSKEECESMKDRDALVRSSMHILRMTPEVFRGNFERALFDTGGVLPGIRIVYAWCDESMTDSVYAAKYTLDRLKAARAEGTVVRDIDFYKLEGCNHVVSDTV